MLTKFSAFLLLFLYEKIYISYLVNDKIILPIMKAVKSHRISDVKRDLQGQMKMNETLDQYYDLVEVYKELDEYDQEMIWSIIQIVKKINEKKKIEQKRVD